MARSVSCWMLGWFFLAGLPCIQAEDEFPPAEELSEAAGLPDPLRFFDGRPVESAEAWREERRGELIRLFEHYMYGRAPAAPEVHAEVVRTDSAALGGRAVLQEVTLSYGPAGTPPLEMLLIVPSDHDGPVPVFLGLNFCGNHTVLDDPRIRLPQSWQPDFCAQGAGNRATDAQRGSQHDVWSPELVIDRGYALATCYCGDIDPDRPDFSDGVHPHFLPNGQTALGPHDWGTIAAWAWGISRMVDYLETRDDLDPQRMAVVGHSRLGKTTLLAAALDERIDLAIPHQAGCGGTAPSRGTVGESVKQINDRFPHWFCDEFTQFNDCPQRLPFDQHCLVALVAPRPVLLSNALEDQWANPDGQFEMLVAASPVYALLGVDGLPADAKPELGNLALGRLGYFLRPGKHSMTPEDWQAFLAFADYHFARR